MHVLILLHSHDTLDGGATACPEPNVVPALGVQLEPPNSSFGRKGNRECVNDEDEDGLLRCDISVGGLVARQLVKLASRLDGGEAPNL